MYILRKKKILGIGVMVLCVRALRECLRFGLAMLQLLLMGSGRLGICGLMATLCT